MPVKHQFVSAKADDPDATLINPSNWNANHSGDNVLDKNLTTQTVTNSVAEGTIYTFTIPAGELGAAGGIKLRIAGTILVNAAGTLTIRVKLGATTILATEAVDPADTVNTFKFGMDLLLMNVTATSQKAGASLLAVTRAASFAIAGATTEFFMGVGYGTAAEDTTLVRALVVTVQWSAASVNLSFVKEMALLEKVSPT